MIVSDTGHWAADSSRVNSGNTPARYGDLLGHADIYCDIAGAGQAAGGPARIHRPPEHPREQILLHGQEPGRGRETVRTLGGVRQDGV